MAFEELSRYLKLLAKQEVPGLDCIVMRGHEVIFRQMEGFSDPELNRMMTGQELFNIYSISKIVTAIAVLQLNERGSLLLTDPLYKYLPEYRHMTVLEKYPGGDTVLRSAAEPIRILHLLTMTSGMDYRNGEEIRPLLEGNVPCSAVDFAKALSRRPLQFEPGTRFAYSFSYDVLGALVERVSGMGFGAYLKQNIFDPLDMTSTGFDRRDWVMERVMAQYKKDMHSETTLRLNSAGMAYWETGDMACPTLRVSRQNALIPNPCFESGGAGLISCTRDCALLADALANWGEGHNGSRILSRASVELMRTNQLNGQQLADMAIHGLPGYGYGLGVRTMLNPAIGGSLSPVGEFGWSGAAGAFLLADPQNRISLFFGAHLLGGEGVSLQMKLRNTLYAGL